jgi:pyruvate/2-oxoglutarate dehydrogenase complex dihydrolipoamide acyltransferase (E2) component
MVDIVIDPQRWESLEAGDTALIDEWLVSENEHVAAGQLLGRALLVHERVDVVAPHAGCVEEILVPAGERFGPGHVLARLVAF